MESEQKLHAIQQWLSNLFKCNISDNGLGAILKFKPTIWSPFWNTRNYTILL